MSVYEQLKVRRVVNARGRMTLLGGSILPKEVLDAMMEANRYYVNMAELQDRAGGIIAQILGAEDACVTSGAFSALVLAAAACMTRMDSGLMERVPHTEGMRNEVIIQRGLRTKYDRSMTVAGAKLVEVGDEKGTTPKHIEEAISDRTAAVHFLAPGGSRIKRILRHTPLSAVHFLAPGGREGAMPLQGVLSIAKKHSIPVIVDAAGQVFPPENMKRYVAMGIDLTCYGAKYFDGPNSAGLLVGRKDLVEAAKLQNFVGFETTATRAIGRGMKLDRQEIVATVVALQRWMKLDHRARLQAQHKRIECLVSGLNKILGVRAVEAGERMGISTSAHVTLDRNLIGLTASQVSEALKAGNPSVWVGLSGENVAINAETMVEDDEQVVLQRMKEVLSGASKS